MPITDRDLSFDTILPLKMIFEDDFLFGFPPPTPFIFPVGGPPSGIPLVGGPIKVGGVPGGALWENPTLFSSLLSVAFATGKPQHVEAAAPPLPPPPDLYFCSVDSSTDAQFVTMKVPLVPPPIAADSHTSMVLARGTPSSKTAYFLAVRNIIDGSDFQAEWEVGYMVAGVLTILSGPTAFEPLDVSGPATPIFPIVSMTFEVRDDGGTGADLRVRSYDTALAAPIDVTVNDADPAGRGDGALLTGLRQGLATMVTAGSVPTAGFAPLWRAGDL